MRNATPAQRKSAFKALQSIWYAKLAATGFIDIEYGREDGPLKVACRENRGIDPLTYTSTLEYYSQASEYLHARRWTSFLEREVWRHHADGVSLRDIAAALGELLAPDTSASWQVKRVHAIVRAHQRAHKVWRDEGCPKAKPVTTQLALWS